MSIPPGLVLARLDALADPSALIVTPDDATLFTSVILTRRGAHIAAFRNKCPHAGYPLQPADGRIVFQEGRYIILRCAARVSRSNTRLRRRSVQR